MGFKVPAKEMSDYWGIKHSGPEEKGYEHAVGVFERITKASDKNLELMGAYIGDKNMKSLLPEGNHEEVKKVAEALNLQYTLKMLG